MFGSLSLAAARFRIAISRGMTYFGFREDSFLMILAALIGVVTAIAAVAFHQLIDVIRRALYHDLASHVALYGRGIVLLVLLPALGGLVVGVVTNYVIRARAGTGIIDVMESVMRGGGNVRPGVALEKILTAAVTIGTGGSAGAEGPIVQIGAGIASGVAQFFRVARQHTPVMIGCGCAAGISAIFNSPMGGLLFTLEVIMRDFSLRSFTPVVIASVIANFTTQAIFHRVLGESYSAIFVLPHDVRPSVVYFSHLGNFLFLGVLCGAIGVTLTRLMHAAEDAFARLRLPRAMKPALGGAALGALGVLYIIGFGWFLLGQPKPFKDYAMPAFFGDGYGVVQTLLQRSSMFYGTEHTGKILVLLASLCALKVIGTCLTLGSGGSGGIIAPSLFLGATAGAVLGLLLRATGVFGSSLEPHVYALVGMAAVLAAVVHAPLASILILFEVTRDYEIILPAMLATIIATSVAQLIFRDSIYTISLRERGVRLGSAGDLTLLRRIRLEEVALEPASVVRADEPFQRVLDLTANTGATDFIVLDKVGNYGGMVVAEDIKTALLEREAIPLLNVGEMMRAEIPLVRPTDDLAGVLDIFSRHDVGRLPVCLAEGSGRVIGLVSRAALMKRYQRALSDAS